MPIKIKRNYLWQGWILAMNIIVNGEKVAKATWDKYVEVEIPGDKALLRVTQLGIKSNEIEVKDGDVIQLMPKIWYSVAYSFLLLLILFTYKISNPTIRLNDIGVKNGIIVFIVTAISIITLTLSFESTNRYSDPINSMNVNKYKVICCLQVTAMVSNSIILMNYELDLKMRITSNLILIILGLIVVLIHNSIIKQYKALDNNKIDKFISRYRLQKDEELIYRVSAVRHKFYYSFWYVIICSLFIEYIFINIITTIIFIILNILIIHKLFKDVLTGLYEYLGDLEKVKKILLYACVFPSFAIILIYFIYKEIIYVPIFSGRDLLELYIIFLFSFIPFLSALKNCAIVELRMTMKWHK